jgi:fumarylacetoacetate (FAA) hydrolase family protein
MEAKRVLMRDGMWSQYLEVGIGPDAEIFTKAQPMSAVGCGAKIGLHPKSLWNNPEPEIVLAVNSRGDIVGATLGNDVNLRDFEGRSALLLSKAKDNNASCAIGPFVRLFDKTFSLDDVRHAEVRLEIRGKDHFTTDGTNSMREISRDPVELVAATIGKEHQYPDGLMLFLGTMFVPTKDRREAGSGFTHEEGDDVRPGAALAVWRARPDAFAFGAGPTLAVRPRTTAY